MKIAVVGTSNSILVNGYFPVYQALEYPNQTDNFSIGGANCQLIPYSIEKYKIFDTYDFLITDCAVNDGDYLASNSRSPDWLYNELYSIMSMIKEAPIRHLHLIFPTDMAYNKHYQIHCQVCRELDIPYMDIEKIVSAAKNSGQKKLFYDSKHISLFLAKQLAYLIKEERKNIFSSPKLNDVSACYKHKKYIFCSLPEKFKGEFPTCTKSSSLLSDTYLVLKDSDTLCFENLPELNLESISFWTNTNAGYYTLTTEKQKQNHNSYYPDAHYTNFRPLAKKPFPINKFLKLQAGIDPNIPKPLQENTFPPVSLENNELFLNAVLFSEELNPPLTWQVKNFPEKPANYLPAFQKINSICANIDKYMHNNLQYIPDDCIFIAAVVYPQNSLLRKQYLTILKRTDNPYFAYYYAELYLVPRKKYALAVTILNTVKKQKIIINAISLLVHCYLQLKQFDNALDTIETLSEEKYRITQLRLLCSIYAHMDLPELFFQEAEQLLELNENFSTLFHIIDNCIILKKYEEALNYAKQIYAEPRNFFYKQHKKSIIKKVSSVLSYLNKETL